jgi:GMP synthase (glutamine-hydrolysing)
MSTPEIAVLITGDPVPQTRASRGGFFELIVGAAATGLARFVACDVRNGERLPPLDGASGVIVTGSPASVTDELPWMLSTGAELARLVSAGVPTLGICFGHQLLGRALGGRVGLNPRGREMGTVDLDVLESDPVVGSRGRHAVNATHVDSVIELPPGARVLATTAQEPHAAVRFSERSWGVQFHPEVDGQVLRHYLSARRELLASEGFDFESTERAAADTPAGAAVIEQFVREALRIRR